jgi:hypothetical protein
MSFRSTGLAVYVAALSLLPLTSPCRTALAQEAPVTPVPAQLGLEVQTVPTASQIVVGSPAEKAGFRVNDRVLLLDGKPVADAASFVKTVAALPQRQAIVVTVLRQGAEMTIRATLDDFAAAPAPTDGKPAPPRGRLGLGLADLVVVTSLTPGGRAQNAGVRRGDRIEEINLSGVDTLAQVTRKLAGSVYRGRAVLKLRRDGQTTTVTIELGDPLPYVVTAEDDRAAAKHFRPLAGLYKEIADDPGSGSDRYLGEVELLSATVLDLAHDTPKPGQSIYVLSTPGDYTKAGAKAGAVFVLWPEKAAVARFKAGDTLYLRARLENIRLPEGATPLELVLHGEEAFASPGAAFNPVRPLLRTSGQTPEGTVLVTDLVKQTRANAADVLAKFKGKPVQYEGVVHRLQQFGQNYSISFYPDGTPEKSNRELVSLHVRGDVGGALKGFKKGERLRIRASLTSAVVEVEEVDDFLNGGKKKESTLKINLDASNFVLDDQPL